MSSVSFALLTTGALTGQRYSTTDDALISVNTPAGTFAVPGLYDSTLYRYDLSLNAIVLRDPTPVSVQLLTSSVVLSGVPLGAVITVGGDTSLTVTNTNPAGVVTLNFAAPGNYTLAVSCFPSQDFTAAFKLPPTVTPAAGALLANGNAPTLLPLRITVPSGALAAASTGLAQPVSAIVPKVASLSVAGSAASVARNIPTTTDMSMEGFAPTAVVQVQNRTIAPSAAALRMQTGFTYPLKGALTLSGSAPALTMSGSAGNIVAGTGALTLLAVDNALLSSGLATGAAGLALVGVAPLVLRSVVPKTAALTLTVNPVAVPYTGELNLTGN